jgi:hypothetical protein
MSGRLRAVLALAVLGVFGAGCSVLSDFGGYQFADADDDTEDGGHAEGGAAESDAGGVVAGGDGGAGCVADDDCDDSDACNGRETCGADGSCVAGREFTCPALDDPCRRNVCVTTAGSPRCVARTANDGDTCAEADDTTEAVSACSRDYVCDQGQCVAATVEMCEAGQCRIRGGCDPTGGCRYIPRPASRDCDDADPCTSDDKCSGKDGTCAGTPKDCGDGVGCTVDTCDEGNCVHTASDAKCEEPCRKGLCDAVMGCGTWTNHDSFAECDDEDGATDPDFCYAGECLGGAETTPTASCAVGGCGCSGFTTVQDLEYMNPNYVGMIDATHTGGGAGCTSGSVSIVAQVTPAALTPYTTDTAGGGAVAGTGVDLVAGYAMTTTAVGALDNSALSVDWIGNDLANAIASGTPAIGNFQGSSRHSTGSFSSGTVHFWFWGDDTTTPSTGRIGKCSWNYCLIMGCVTTKSCVYETLFSTTTFRSVTPYTQTGGGPVFAQSYAGAVASVNLDSGMPIKMVFADHDKDYLFNNPDERRDDEGGWAGSVLHGNGRVLVYGSGPTNLLYCDDSDYDGNPDCAPITGLPNQASRSYYDGSTSGSGDILLLATSTCPGICITWTYYLIALTRGADATAGANWKEYAIGSGGPLSTKHPTHVAASPTSIMVFGEVTNVPHVWSWAP